MEGIKTGFKSFDGATGGLDLRKTYLLVGNKESGKEEFLYRLASSALSLKDAVVYTVTAKSYLDLINEFSSRSLNISQYLGNAFKILDNFSRTNSPNLTDNNYAKVLNGPVDLTGLSVALSTVNSDFVKEGTSVVNVLDSLSTLLVYNNPATIFRFLQFVCGKAKLSGVTSVFSLDDEMHSKDVNETVKSVADAIISLKLEGGKRYFTAYGIAKEVLDWRELD
jgi:RecA-superfamily ATPases implicated in signal transduction